MEFNYLSEQGAIARDAAGTLRDRLREDAGGDRALAKELLEHRSDRRSRAGRGVVREVRQDAGGADGSARRRRSDVPVDIDPQVPFPEGGSREPRAPPLSTASSAPDPAAGPGSPAALALPARLGAIFFSAFYSLYFQIHGLIGPRGILPAGRISRCRRRTLAPGLTRFWFAPTLLWFDAGDAALLTALVWIAPPRLGAPISNSGRALRSPSQASASSPSSARRRISPAYQSDGMLLEAALPLALPRAARPPAPARRDRAAVARGRLPAAVGVVPHLLRVGPGEAPQRRASSGATSRRWTSTTRTVRCRPGSAGTCSSCRIRSTPSPPALTLVVELVVVWLLFAAARASRIACSSSSRRCRSASSSPRTTPSSTTSCSASASSCSTTAIAARTRAPASPAADERERRSRARRRSLRPRTVCLRRDDAPVSPLGDAGACSARRRAARSVPHRQPLRPLRRHDAQPLRDRVPGNARRRRHWIAYPFRYKPQDVRERPGIYAPYQPRFEWNLWFASLGSWQDNRWVLNTEARLLENDPPVLRSSRAIRSRASRRSPSAPSSGSTGSPTSRHGGEPAAGGGGRRSAPMRRRYGAATRAERLRTRRRGRLRRGKSERPVEIGEAGRAVRTLSRRRAQRGEGAAGRGPISPERTAGTRRARSRGSSHQASGSSSAAGRRSRQAGRRSADEPPRTPCGRGRAPARPRPEAAIRLRPRRSRPPGRRPGAPPRSVRGAGRPARRRPPRARACRARRSRPPTRSPRSSAPRPRRSARPRPDGGRARPGPRDRPCRAPA